jgi:tRNA A-37 threonylcarbamoyl transferase component Bud32
MGGMAQERDQARNTHDGLTVTLAPRGATGSASSSKSAGAATSETLLSGEDALRREEIGRIAVFARLTLFLCVGGLALAPVYGGDPMARWLLVGALVLAMLTSTFIAWMTRDPARYRPGLLVAVVQVQELCATVAAYFFGAFSPFPAVVSLAIYVYSLGASFKNALACYLNLAVGQAALAGLIMSGTLLDRGIVRADYLSTTSQLMVQANIQLVYLLAFVLARMSRRKTLAAVAEHAATVRAVAQQEALFEEARQELERAARLGGTGRFSDQRLGAYVLGPVIGRGAMGEVYRAQRADNGEAAAVKLLQRSAWSDPTQLSRFTREAQLAASLDTPHVARVFDVGESPLPYIAMELLEGEDLARRLRDTPLLPLPDVAQLVRQAAFALAAAHARGIIHRDVKPQNLFRTTSGDAVVWKLLDFGISKLTSDEGTLTGAHIVGTPAYMPPEQATGSEVDARADLYALAAVAYRCVTGHPLFPAREPTALLQSVVHLMPAQPSRIASVPGELDAFFAIGLAKRPADRFDRAAALADAFEAAVAGRLDAALRAKASAITAHTPWQRQRSRTVRLAVRVPSGS